MRIFHRRCCFLPGAAFHKETPQRLTASDQAVMAVGKRKHRQEGNRLSARAADASAYRDPVMLFVMSLFPSTTMAHDRIPQANRTPANRSFSRFGPIGFQLALLPAESERTTIVQMAALPDGGILRRSDSRAEPSSPCEISTGKEYRILATPATSIRGLAG